MRIYKPLQLLEELGITEPHEIDLEAIAAFVGATIIVEPLQGTEARLVGTGDKAIITVNSNSSEQRQRFSIGHELGHWMHDRGRAKFECGERVQAANYYGTDPESLANAYATELLLPAFMFRPRLAKQNPTLDTVRELSSIFRTSITATASRVVELGAWPSMLVCSARDRRVWFKASAEVPRKLWPHPQLTDDTLAYGLLRDPNTLEATDEVDADAWIDHPNAGDYAIVEGSVKVTPDLALSLLWWKDQSQLDDLDDDSED